MSASDNHTPLDQILTKYDEGGIKARLSVDSIAAVFDASDPTERAKLARIIQMISHQHLKAAARLTRLLVKGIELGKHGEVLEFIKNFMGDLELAGDTINEAHARIAAGLAIHETILTATESDIPEASDDA